MRRAILPDSHPLFIPFLSPLNTIVNLRAKGESGANLQEWALN